MYLGSENQVFDFSYWVPQQGIKTNTDIVTTGALMDKSKNISAVLSISTRWQESGGL